MHEFDSASARASKHTQAVRRVDDPEATPDDEEHLRRLGTGWRTQPIEVSVRLCSDDEIQALNAEWRGKDCRLTC